MTTKHQPAKPGSKARMIARRDKRIRSQAAELIRLRADRARLVEALRDLMTRCDGPEGVRADGSNIQTMQASAVLHDLGEDV